MSDRDPACPRIIYNDDGSNFLYSWDDLGAEDLRRYLSRLEGTQVDMVVYCVAFGGYVCYYESNVAEPVGSGFGYSDRVKQRRWVHNRLRLRDEVGDYIGFVFQTLRDMGMPAVASVRMNDAHMSSDPAGPVAGRFWMNHPEWRLGEPYGYYRSCLDYSQPAVRGYLRRLVEEVIEKFPDIDGIELDAMRSPFFFKPGEGEAKTHLITELVRDVRADLDAAARAKDRERYLLRVNVPKDPKLALESGLDVAAWDREGWVDGISPGCYNTDFQPVTEEWKTLLSSHMRVHPYLNCSPGPALYHSLEEYRGAAANAWGSGADGVYLFNFPCLDEVARLVPLPLDPVPVPPAGFKGDGRHPDLARTSQALCEIGDPDLLARTDKRYLFYMGAAPYRHYTPERASIDRLEGDSARMVFRCYHALHAREVRLEVKTVAVTVGDAFAFALNGREVEACRVERLHAAGGRDQRVHGIALEPYSLYTLALDPEMLRVGENELVVRVTEREPELFGTIELRELTLTLSH